MQPQRQKQMRGFFPFDYAQGQNDKQKEAINSGSAFFRGF
jgi:hypothetical protein